MARPLRTYQNLVIGSGESVELAGQGRYVVCTSATADFRLAVDDQPPSLFFQGAELLLAPEDADFTSLTLSNDSASAVTVTLFVGFGQIRDRRSVVSGSIFTGGDTLASSADYSHSGSGTEQILAANANRREALIYNDTGATIRVGDSNAGASRGYPLAAGNGLVLATSAAIYAYSSPGGSIALLENEGS
jgi:hypothetical protein